MNMKKFLDFSVICFTLLLCSCNRNNPDMKVPYVEYGWDNFPFERVDCYFPKEATEQMYISDKNNSFKTTIGELTNEYHARPGNDPVEEEDGGFTTATEMYFAYTSYVSNVGNEIITPQNLRIIVDDNRQELAIMLITTRSGQRFSFEARNNSDKPDAIFQYLGDTITLQTERRDKKGNAEVIPNTAKLVKGKGIVMYKTIHIDEETGKFLRFDEIWTLAD